MLLFAKFSSGTTGTLDLELHYFGFSVDVSSLNSGKMPMESVAKCETSQPGCRCRRTNVFGTDDRRNRTS